MAKDYYSIARKYKLDSKAEKAFGYPRWLIAQYLLLARKREEFLQGRIERGAVDKRGRPHPMKGYSRNKEMAIQKMALDYNFNELYEFAIKDPQGFRFLASIAEDIAEVYGIEPEAETHELYGYTLRDS